MSERANIWQRFRNYLRQPADYGTYIAAGVTIVLGTLLVMLFVPLLVQWVTNV